MNDEIAWEVARTWLWHRRRNVPVGADIWDLRFHWITEEKRIRNAVRHREYRLSPMLVVGRQKGERLAQRSARDALVLKWASLHAEKVLPVHSRCEHGKGNGGCVASVHRLHHVMQNAECRMQNAECRMQNAEYKFVLRTDIRGYYRNIVKSQLWFQIQRYVHDESVKEIIRQYLWYCVEDGGEIHTPLTGIPRGCALSPLLGASLLYHVDAGFSAIGDIYYARYMDDFMLLTRTRWRLRQCVAKLNDHFDMRGFEQHPHKTFIGRIDRGFDWLGAAFDEHGAAGLAPRAITHHRERCLRLYEQAYRQGLTHAEAMLKVQTYRERWLTWARRLLPTYIAGNPACLIFKPTNRDTNPMKTTPTLIAIALSICTSSAIARDYTPVTKTAVEVTVIADVQISVEPRHARANMTGALLNYPGVHVTNSGVSPTLVALGGGTFSSDGWLQFRNKNGGDPWLGSRYSVSSKSATQDEANNKFVSNKQIRNGETYTFDIARFGQGTTPPVPGVYQADLDVYVVTE